MKMGAPDKQVCAPSQDSSGDSDSDSDSDCSEDEDRPAGGLIDINQIILNRNRTTKQH